MEVTEEIKELLKLKLQLAEDILRELSQREVTNNFADQLRSSIDAINKLMYEHNVLILEDRGNGSWICLHYQPIHEKSNRQQIVCRSPLGKNFSWSNFNLNKFENDAKISEWLPQCRNPAELFYPETCESSADADDQLLLTVVFAIGCCINYPRCFDEPFGEHGEMKDHVCEAISQTLLKNRMPTIAEVWGNRP